MANKDIWAGVDFGDSIINPGSTYQTYNTSTGQTTYGSAPAGLTSASAANEARGIYAPAVATPQNLPANAQVYQGGGIYSPTGQNSNFIKDAYGNIIPSQESLLTKQNIPVIDTTQQMPSDVFTKAKEAEKKIADIATGQQANVPGKLVSPYELGQGTKLTESDLARTTGNEIYRRDLALEQAKLPEYAKMYGAPKSDADWRKFHDYAYTGRVNVAPTGSNDLNTDSQAPAAPEIANPEGNIDILKLEKDLSTNLKSINDLITQETAAFDTASNEIGNQLGRTMPLVYGEQQYMANRKEIILNRLLDEKQTLLENYDQKIKLYDYARTLRQDQINSYATIIDKFLESGVAISPAIAQQYSKLTGIDAKALEDGFAFAAQNYQTQSSSKGTGDLPSSYQEWQLAGSPGTYAEWQGKNPVSTTDAKQKAVDTLALVKNSLTNAKALAGASGRSGARKAAEAWFIGSTDYTNLEAETNTLRTNVLTLMSDPDIKKFFGPQMSEADVRLMTSAGTTLNPELQSPAKMEAELTRLETLINKMSASVNEEFSW